MEQVYLQVLATFHQVLDVIDGGEEQVEDLEEVMFLLREPCVCQELHQVAKVVTTEKDVNRRTQPGVKLGLCEKDPDQI